MLNKYCRFDDFHNHFILSIHNISVYTLITVIKHLIIYI